MSRFRTIVEVEKCSRRIDHNTFSLWLGSCFTENIGVNLARLKFPVDINPFGVLYNPVSISNSLSILINEKVFTVEDLFYSNGLWNSFSHHSSFSDPDRDVCIQKINEGIKKSSEILEKAVFLFVTFGTARIYRHKETGLVVSNNHKLPHNTFTQELLTVEEIVGNYNLLIRELRKLNKDLQIVFTVSPVRHWKDGATGNLISKSTLMLAIDQLTSVFESASYFPAYELVMDDLRDYRFYDEDMIHINRQGVDYIWKKFSDAYISDSSLPLVKEILAIKQGLDHRPFNPSGPDYQLFLANILARIGEVEMSGTSIDFSPEKELIRSWLKDQEKSQL
ncbi:MAG: GSCFA domain-containing protein [Bacteroidales bacterium]